MRLINGESVTGSVSGSVDSVTGSVGSVTAAVTVDAVTGDGTTDSALGIGVTKSAANLPQGVAAAIFNVTGGRVVITSLIGEVTSGIEALANDTKITATPSTGTGVDLCVVLDINNNEVGALYGLTGIYSDALQGGVAGAVCIPSRPIVVNTGSIDLDCASSRTGQMKWALTYLPLDSGASVAGA